MKNIQHFCGKIAFALLIAIVAMPVTASAQNQQAVNWLRVGINENDTAKKITAFKKALATPQSGRCESHCRRRSQPGSGVDGANSPKRPGTEKPRHPGGGDGFVAPCGNRPQCSRRVV